MKYLLVMKEASMNNWLKRLNKVYSLLLLFFIGFAHASWGKDIPAKSNHLVNDYANILSAEENNALERKLVAYYDSTSTQIAVVIERSLDGDDLFDYCQRLADGWGIGVKGKNNGILIYVAIDDRKTRIHTGYGMEASITDALSTRIRTTQMNPAFKAGNFYEGLDEATTTIMLAASGEYTNEDNDKPMQKGPSMAVIFIIIIIIIILISRGGGGRGNRYRGGFGGPVFWGGTFGSGGFSGGGSSGGGFGGFGGGGFGGGGSGGSW